MAHERDVIVHVRQAASGPRWRSLWRCRWSLLRSGLLLIGWLGGKFQSRHAPGQLRALRVVAGRECFDVDVIQDNVDQRSLEQVIAWPSEAMPLQPMSFCCYYAFAIASPTKNSRSK